MALDSGVTVSDVTGYDNMVLRKVYSTALDLPLSVHRYEAS